MAKILTRRALLTSTAAAAALSLSSCGETAAPAKRRKVVYAGAFALPKSIDEQLWIRFEQLVEQQVPDFDVRLVIRGETGPEEATFAALRRGRIHIAGGSFAGVATIVPEISILSAPFLFDSEAEVDFVMDQFMYPAFDALFAAKGLRLLQWTDVGWVNLYAKRVILTPEAARGVRLRASSALASQAFIAQIGGDTITMPFSDVLPSLQTGLIDGGVTSVTMYSLSGITSEAPNYVLTQHSYDMGVLLANAKWLAGTSAAAQRAIATGFGGAAQTRRNARGSVHELMQSLPTKGVRIYVPSPLERAAWRAAAWPAHEKLLDRIGGQARQIYAQLLAGKRAFAAQAVPLATATKSGT
jgi:TRAP-type C4-dicarboxylate transport system substrate-binding protein